MCEGCASCVGGCGARRGGSARRLDSLECELCLGRRCSVNRRAVGVTVQQIAAQTPANNIFLFVRQIYGRYDDILIRECNAGSALITRR